MSGGVYHIVRRAPDGLAARPAEEETLTRRCPSRFPRPFLAGLCALILAAGAPGCSDEQDDGPVIDEVVRITETTFVPNEITVFSGARVQWENRVRFDRTVTSGRNADDPVAGASFDEMLRGYRSGEVVGGLYQRVFVNPDTLRPDTVEYFSRLVPDGFVGTMRGRVIVLPTP